MKKVIKNDLLEILASLEHKQWIDWSKQLVKEENISEERVKRWEKYWIPYNNLPEEIKDLDRKYAKKVINIINNKI